MSFLTDVARHRMDIRLENGLYRHLRFSRPDTGNMSFNLITWPGYLAYSGDMGDYVFARIPDMFAFFRGDGINPSYWAEKVQAADRAGVKAYCPKAARRCIEEHIEGRELTDEVREQVWRFPYDEGEHELRRAMEDCEGNAFAGAWEFDLHDYTFRYLWCCHALVWGIRQYDAAKATPAEIGNAP